MIERRDPREPVGADAADGAGRGAPPTIFASEQAEKLVGAVAPGRSAWCSAPSCSVRRCSSPTAAARARSGPAAARRVPSWCCHLRLRRLPRRLAPARLDRARRPARGGPARLRLADRARAHHGRRGLVAWLAGRAAPVATHRPSPQAIASSSSYAPERRASSPRPGPRRSHSLGDALVAGRCWRCSGPTWSSPGQPWGIVYGMGVWGARRSPRSAGTSRATPSGAWRRMPAPGRAHPRRRHLGDQHRPDLRRDRRLALERRAKVSAPSGRRLAAAAVAGLVMGYSAHGLPDATSAPTWAASPQPACMAGCGSPFAFAGSILGVRIRRRVGA